MSASVVVVVESVAVVVVVVVVVAVAVLVVGMHALHSTGHSSPSAAPTIAFEHSSTECCPQTSGSILPLHDGVVVVAVAVVVVVTLVVLLVHVPQRAGHLDATSAPKRSLEQSSK